MTSMMDKIRKMEEDKIITPPRFVIGGCQFMTMTGSIAYGCNEKGKSDLDIIGFTIPPKAEVFPHLAGHIHKFGRQKKGFDQWQKHGVKGMDGKSEYDFDIYNIVKYFMLCMENNPNMVDSLFTPEFCVLFKTEIGEMVRTERKIFLHKGSYHRFKGYAYSQLKKARDKREDSVKRLREFELEHDISHETTFQEVEEEMQRRGFMDGQFAAGDNVKDFKDLHKSQLIEYYEMYMREVRASKRFESQKIYNVDLKFLYHIVRLADEAEQILEFGDIDLQRNKEMMKAVRRGDMSYEDVEGWFHDKEKHLEKLYHSSKAVPDRPDEGRIKQLLLDCLEQHYGSLEGAIVVPGKARQVLRDIQELLDKHRELL